VVCRSGIEWVLRLNLSEKEVEALQQSAQILNETIGRLEIVNHLGIEPSRHFSEALRIRKLRLRIQLFSAGLGITNPTTSTRPMHMAVAQ
jgi:hypothetical protein